jgi:hypothetical protein
VPPALYCDTHELVSDRVVYQTPLHLLT